MTFSLIDHPRHRQPVAKRRTARMDWAARHNRLKGDVSCAIQCIRRIADSPTATPEAQSLAQRALDSLQAIVPALDERDDRGCLHDF